MIENENEMKPAPANKNKEIDLLALARDIWAIRKKIIIWCAIGAVVGLIIAFSIPKEYKSDVKLAPEENSGSSLGGSLGALAAMAGVNMGSMGGEDALYPQLYPEIMESVPFCLSLFDVPLTDKDGEREFTFEQYLKDGMKSPWWSFFTKIPGKIIKALKGEDEDGKKGRKPDPFRLTEKQAELVKAIRHIVNVQIDNKTYVVTITVTTQDPLVSALMADTVVSRLQEFVTDYRTNKARKDLDYIDNLNEEAKAAYYAAQQKYANYLDTHQGLVMYSAQTMRDRLENEATLAFNMFNQTSQQLQIAKAKVQEQTPVFATITPATVPVRASAPKKLFILAGAIFLAFCAACVWYLFIKPVPKAEENKESGK